MQNFNGRNDERVGSGEESGVEERKEKIKQDASFLIDARSGTACIRDACVASHSSRDRACATGTNVSIAAT